MSEAEESGIYDAEYSDSDSDDESETGASEESDSDSSDVEEGEDDDEFIAEESQIVEVQEASGISSDEGGEKESCPICLNRFIGQDLGTPESCDHTFCLECIREWSKNINTCPIDRTEFNYVNLKSAPNGKILKKIKVKVRPKEPENALQQEVTLCEVCHLGDREDRLLLCDACDLAYHCECLDPPLFRVPIEEWFCPPCSGILQNGAVAGPSVPRSRRVIPRTRASENVRTRVQDRRTRPAIPRSPSNARKRAPQKRKRRAYRRSYKKVVTLARTKKNLMDGSKGKCPRSTAVIVTYRRRRRRRKKRRVATKSASASKSRARSANKRISKHLGLVESSKGGFIPDVKSKTKSTSKSATKTGSSHYLFGDRNQLMDFNESFHEDVPGPSRNRQQEVVTPQPSTSSINILDSIMAGQKILHTKANDVIIKTDGSLVMKENKTKVKGTIKKPLGSDKAKEKEIVEKSNASEKSNEKEKGAIKKPTLSDKTKDQRKGIIKKPDVSNKAKSSRVTFGEPSNLGTIPKAEKHSERKPSPMLLAALARRRENEISNQSVSDYKSNSSSSIKRNATSADNHQHSSLLNQSDHNLDVQTNIDQQNFSKQSLKSKINKSSSSYKAVDKPSNYSHESSLKKSVRAGPIKSNFDDFQNSGLSNSSSDNLSFSCTEPKTSRVKYETNNKRSLFKSENVKESPKYSCLSPNQELNNVSSFHDVAFSTSFESTRAARQSCFKNENISSDGHVKETEIQKYIKKEETNDFFSEKSTVASSSTNATFLMPSETEEDDTMELIPSQSLIQGNSDVLLTSLSDVKQLSFDIKKESYSFSEKSDSECSQSLVEPLHKRFESNYQAPHKSLNNKVNNLKLKIKRELESSDDDCQSPNVDSANSFNKSRRQTINAIMDDDDDTVGFEDSPSIISQTVAETTTKTGQTCRKRHKDEINSDDDETNIHHVLKSYSQSKSMTNLRNNKNVSEDFSKIKIKEELPSSSDEGGESCSLLTDDLPFTQLAERNNLPYTNLENPTFSCTQAINSLFNEQGNDLSCTQLAETTCDKKDKSLFSHSSKSPWNKLKDDLPCTQPVGIHAGQEEDLSCTQLVKSASITPQFRKDDDLSCAKFVKPAPVKCLKEKGTLQSLQSSSPLSNMQMDKLPFTQLVESSAAKHFSGEKEDALPCTQLARPVYNMVMGDLRCTQFVSPMKGISMKEEDALPATRPSSPMSQMQSDDLPCTQLVEPSSKNYVSKEKEDALSCTQLAISVSRMEAEDLPCTQLARPPSSIQMDDLPATQFVVPAPVKNSIRKVDSLPATQPTSPLSQIQMDDLPCTQLVESTSKNSVSDEEEDTLPCTQLSSMGMEDLPCTQLARPLSSIQMDDLPATQFVVPAPVKYSKRKVDSLPATQPTSPLSQIHMDDLPCTQLGESTSKNSVSDEEEDTLPCTQLSSMGMENLPCTQLARPLSSMQMDGLPATQFVVPAPVKYSKRKVVSLPATQPTSPLSQIHMDDLPCTQVVESTSNNSVFDDEEDTLPCTQLSSLGMEDLPCTQLARPLSSIQMDDLPATQFVVPAPVKYSKRKVDSLPATQPTSPLSQIQTDDLPCTELVEPSSKNSVSDEEEDTLPCTQLSRPVSSLGMEDLPCTQLARPLSSIQMDDLPATQFVVPAPVKYASKKEANVLPATQPFSPFSQMQTDDLPCTQLVELTSAKSLSDKEEDSLPCTQLAPPKSNLHSRKSQNNHHNRNAHVQSKELPACSEKLSYDANAQTKQKQSDNFQETKNCQENLLTTQLNISAEHSTENSENLSNLNSNFDDDLDLPETQPLTFDQHHSKSKELLQENSNDEQVTDEELLSNIDKLKITRPPAKKVVGVHKNLPQVLMPILSRRIPVPKPSNRITFSFDQVKQQYDTIDNKYILQKNISHGRMLAVTKIGDPLTKQRLDSVLKKEQQISSECKAKNTNNFKNEKSPLDESEILVSSIPNCDLKVEIDKSNVPADSEIEIINDNEINRMKNIEEFVLSSDEEDLPATQFIDRTTDQFSNLPNQRKPENFCVSIKKELTNSNILPETQHCIVFEKSVDSVNVSVNDLEKVVVKKEVILEDFKVENVKTLNSLSVKQEKCKENILSEIKMEPLQHVKSKEKVSRLIKSENKSHDSKNITISRKVQCADKCANQKRSNTKNISNNNVSRYVRSHEKHVGEHKSKTDITDHYKKSVRDQSISSDVEAKLEKEKKRKTEGSSEMKIHSNAENKAKIENRYLSETKSNSNIKLNTENVNQIKLVSKDKKLKTENSSSSHAHAKGEHIKNHKLVTEKPKSSLKEDNYHEDSKRRKHNSLDDSKKVQDHKKLKVDSLTIKNEPTTDKNRKHGFEKSFDNRKETHKFKNIIEIEDTRQKSSERSMKTEKMSNSGKVPEIHVSNDEKSRNDKKPAKTHFQTSDSRNSCKYSSEKNSKVGYSSSHDEKRNGKYINSDNRCKEFEIIPLNGNERLKGRIKVESDSEKKVRINGESFSEKKVRINGESFSEKKIRIKGESDSENKVSNRLKESKTNFKDESTRTGLVVKRSDSSEGERNTKRPRLESRSCNEDISDSHSDYSRSSEISSESNFQKKYKHQRNALNSLNEIADEIITVSKNHKTDILNQDENVDLEVIKRSKDPSSLGRKVDKAHLKDEIAAEVKIALKPFYTVGLIDKEDYKDIMRKAVPKIFMNCGNFVNPEKIKNLVTSYVKKLTNS